MLNKINLPNPQSLFLSYCSSAQHLSFFILVSKCFTFFSRVFHLLPMFFPRFCPLFSYFFPTFLEFLSFFPTCSIFVALYHVLTHAWSAWLPLIGMIMMIIHNVNQTPPLLKVWFGECLSITSRQVRICAVAAMDAENIRTPTNQIVGGARLGCAKGRSSVPMGKRQQVGSCMRRRC